mgnify:FL=1
MKTMKFYLIALVSVLVLPACAERDRVITMNDLPTEAQTFLKNFSQKKIALIKMEREGLSKEYDVVFTDGSNIGFNAGGYWKEINNHQSAVPESVVPAQIKDFVNTNYPGTSIIQIERSRHNYEIELSNKFDIKFDTKFRVTDIED